MSLCVVDIHWTQKIAAGRPDWITGWRLVTWCLVLKEQYRHDQSRLSTGHGIGVLVQDEHNDWKWLAHILWSSNGNMTVGIIFSHWVDLKTNTSIPCTVDRDYIVNLKGRYTNILVTCWWRFNHPVFNKYMIKLKCKQIITTGAEVFEETTKNFSFFFPLVSFLHLQRVTVRQL